MTLSELYPWTDQFNGWPLLRVKIVVIYFLVQSAIPARCYIFGVNISGDKGLSGEQERNLRPFSKFFLFAFSLVFWYIPMYLVDSLGRTTHYLDYILLFNYHTRVKEQKNMV